MQLTVVLIDDIADIRLLLREMLAREGTFKVVAEAANGRAGIEAVRKHQPDVVLLDVAMPLMDGMEALPEIRRCCPRACIVVLSGFTADRLREEALQNGATAYVEKGILPTQLMPLLAKLCGVAATTR